MRTLKLLLPVAFVFLFIRCETKSVETKAYLDIDSLINAQIAGLVKAKARVVKSAALENQVDKSEFVPDSLGWTSELDIFRQLDMMNKPTYKDAYQITDGGKDTNSNLTVRSYKVSVDKAYEDAPVRELNLYYYQNLRNLKKIEAVLTEQNALYFTDRTLILIFDEREGKNILTHYTIGGLQKMIASDTVHFHIDCSVLF